MMKSYALHPRVVGHPVFAESMSHLNAQRRSLRAGRASLKALKESSPLITGLEGAESGTGCGIVNFKLSGHIVEQSSRMT